MTPVAMPLASLLERLDERHPIFDDQPRRAVARIRANTLFALSCHELPDAALPFVLEELDTAIEPILVAAAATALRAYPRPSSDLAPFVLRSLENIRAHEDFVTIGDTDTSPLRELFLTLAWLGPLAQLVLPGLIAAVESRPLPTRLRGQWSEV